MTQQPDNRLCVGYRTASKWLHTDCLKCARREGPIDRGAIAWMHNVVIYGARCEFRIESKAI